MRAKTKCASHDCLTVAGLSVAFVSMVGRARDIETRFAVKDLAYLDRDWDDAVAGGAPCAAPDRPWAEVGRGHAGGGEVRGAQPSRAGGGRVEQRRAGQAVQHRPRAARLVCGAAGAGRWRRGAAGGRRTGGGRRLRHGLRRAHCRNVLC